ncbi:Alkyltransferase-like protein 1 [Sporothrix bragantina]|uniref:Alkyltransferase-like protein 1 n=1 Tax=Sporothrix bragantina TaxID=671064 RepID=A0ABP0BXT2_9PEZI
MPRSDEAESFFFAAYSAVQEVPYGKVTSYGHIAMLIGTPQRPRQIGVCLKHLPEEGNVPEGMLSRFHSGSVPWQRIISAKGVISPRGLAAGGAGGRNRQAVALRAEGVEVMVDALGELSVDLDRYGWFPRQLPSEAAGERRRARENDNEAGESQAEVKEEEVKIKEEDSES